MNVKQEEEKMPCGNSEPGIWHSPTKFSAFRVLDSKGQFIDFGWGWDKGSRAFCSDCFYTSIAQALDRVLPGTSKSANYHHHLEKHPKILSVTFCHPVLDHKDVTD